MEAPLSALPGVGQQSVLGPADHVLHEHLQLVSRLLPTPKSPAHTIFGKIMSICNSLLLFNTYCVPGIALSNLWS